MRDAAAIEVALLHSLWVVPDGAPPRRIGDYPMLLGNTSCPAVPRRGPGAGSPHLKPIVFLRNRWKMKGRVTLIISRRTEQNNGYAEFLRNLKTLSFQDWNPSLHHSRTKEKTTKPGTPQYQFMIIYLDGKYLPEDQARISVFDHGFLYGDGVF